MPGFLRHSALLRLALTAALSLAAAVDAAPQGSPPSGGEPLHVMCPVTAEEAVDPEIFTEYQGQQITFCCLREIHRRRTNFRAALRYRLSRFPGTGLVSVVGVLDGSLVYGLDHDAW